MRRRNPSLAYSAIKLPFSDAIASPKPKPPSASARMVMTVQASGAAIGSWLGSAPGLAHRRRPARISTDIGSATTFGDVNYTVFRGQQARQTGAIQSPTPWMVSPRSACEFRTSPGSADTRSFTFELKWVLAKSPSLPPRPGKIEAGAGPAGRMQALAAYGAARQHNGTLSARDCRLHCRP